MAIAFSVLSQVDGVPVPTISSHWWNIAEKQDLPADLVSGKEQPVDFAVWQARDKSWQLWSCIRGTNVGGNGRLFYGWEGPDPRAALWFPKGLKMKADPSRKEREGGLQAPHVIQHKGRYWMFYGDWDRICLATSDDGINFERWKGKDGTPGLFTEKLGSNPRDPMVIRTKGKWYCYYTAMPNDQGVVFCRTSADLTNWSESRVVAFGGEAGTNSWSSECPHVVEYKPGLYYLFRTQKYGPESITRVYASKDPTMFGINQDEKYLVGSLPIAAPEVLKLGNEWFLFALRTDYGGIRAAKLEWR